MAGERRAPLNLLLTRRQLLRSAAAGAPLVFFPRLAHAASAFEARTPAGFLSASERAQVEAITARIIPTEDTVGARETGVADYIQGLLSAFPAADANGDGRRGAADLTAIARAIGSTSEAADVDGDGIVTGADLALARTSLFAGRPIFGKGPFSNRNPFPDPATGTPSDRFPRNDFVDFVPLSRVQTLAWTVRLLGAGEVPEVADNPLASSLPNVDLRRRYREGLALFDSISQQAFGAPFVDLGEAQQDMVIDMARKQPAGASFFDLVRNHTIEGFLCVPEYGGNRDLLGWTLVRFDGDSQPLGYTLYDETAQTYRERDDKPNSTANPDEDCSGLSEEMLKFVRFVVQLVGGTEFSEPFCLLEPPPL